LKIVKLWSAKFFEHLATNMQSFHCWHWICTIYKKDLRMLFIIPLLIIVLSIIGYLIYLDTQWTLLRHPIYYWLKWATWYTYLHKHILTIPSHLLSRYLLISVILSIIDWVIYYLDFSFLQVMGLCH